METNGFYRAGLKLVLTAGSTSAKAQFAYTSRDFLWTVERGFGYESSKERKDL